MMRSVIHKLGSRGVSIGFGMTEGSPIWSAPVSDPEKLIKGDDVVCGTAVPGVHVKICAPDSTNPLPRGQPGEIHQSGPGVIASYIGKSVGSESFYIEDGRTWFKSGDRGVMWADGGVSIVGRYVVSPIFITLQMSLHKLDTNKNQIQRHDHQRR
jgi:acyl-CoA synthetase (AMP-forming)/AMP-acid ligase II